MIQTLSWFCAAASGPLATLAGVYQDVNGQRLEMFWRETVLLWTDGLVEVLHALLGNPQLRPLARAGVTTFSVALDVVRNLHDCAFFIFVLDHRFITINHFYFGHLDHLIDLGFYGMFMSVSWLSFVHANPLVSKNLVELILDLRNLDVLDTSVTQVS